MQRITVSGGLASRCFDQNRVLPTSSYVSLGSDFPSLQSAFRKAQWHCSTDPPKCTQQNMPFSNGPSVAQKGDVEQYFVLNERGEPQLEPDAEAWTRWFEQADRSIARTTVTPHVTVLTTFRGVSDAGDPDDAPRLFETRVFGGVLDAEEVAHRTRAEAMAAHGALAEWCRVGNAPDAGLSEEILN